MSDFPMGRTQVVSIGPVYVTRYSTCHLLVAFSLSESFSFQVFSPKMMGPFLRIGHIIPS